MKKQMLRLSVALLTLLMSQQAFALFELRVNYGLNVVDPGDFSSGAVTEMPLLTDLSGLGVDAVVSLPLMPIGFGLRYSMLSSSRNLGTSKLTTNFDSAALIVNWRLIDTGIYVGAIGTMGLTHTVKTKLQVSGATTIEATAGNASSLSVGAEAGVHLLGMLVGAEAGYTSSSASAFSGTGSSLIGKMALDGLYAKIQAGLSF